MQPRSASLTVNVQPTSKPCSSTYFNCPTCNTSFWVESTIKMGINTSMRPSSTRKKSTFLTRGIGISTDTIPKLRNHVPGIIGTNTAKRKETSNQTFPKSKTYSLWPEQHQSKNSSPGQDKTESNSNMQNMPGILDEDYNLQGLTTMNYRDLWTPDYDSLFQFNTSPQSSLDQAESVKPSTPNSLQQNQHYSSPILTTSNSSITPTEASSSMTWYSSNGQSSPKSIWSIDLNPDRSTLDMELLELQTLLKNGSHATNFHSKNIQQSEEE